MQLKYRKPSTTVTTEQLNKTITAYYRNHHPVNNPLDYETVGPGWNNIVLNLHNKLVAENPNYQIIQVKEKFGTLRYYTEGVGEEGQMFITDAENASSEICEQCGRKGKIRTKNPWVKTLCGVDALINKINNRLRGI